MMEGRHDTEGEGMLERSHVDYEYAFAVLVLALHRLFVVVVVKTRMGWED